MGLGQLAEEAVNAAEGDMARVQAAADAISAAIKKVQPLLNSGTWQGPAATAWTGEWNSLYAAVASCLNGLPAAEANVVAQVRTQMEKMIQQHARQLA
jgi:uncharacterized protein YukE